MFDTVIVPVAYQDEPDLAVTYGATIARQGGAKLELFTVRPAYVLEDRAHRHLAEIAQRCGVDAELRVTPTGDSASVIAMAGTTSKTLLCMQTHARGPAADLLLGSVSEQVVRMCRRPTLLVGPACDPAPERYDSMVVALDGSSFAERILPVVREWSVGLRVTPWLFEVQHEYVPFEAGVGDAHEAAYVHNIARALEKQGVKACWDTARDRHPAAAIARFAALHQPGLVAMTTHGRSAPGLLALGGVALEVAHEATVPVLVHRPEDRAEPLPGTVG